MNVDPVAATWDDGVAAAVTTGAFRSSAPLDSGSVFLAVVEEGPRISFAAYNEEENTIYLETSFVDGYEVEDQVLRVLEATRPTLLLLPNKVVSNYHLLALLTNPPSQLDEANILEAPGVSSDVTGNAITDSQPGMPAVAQPHAQHPTGYGGGSIPYRILKTSSLDVRTCKVSILNLRVQSASRQGPHHSSARLMEHRTFPLSSRARSFPVSNYHALASLIDFDCKIQVQAVGSLLSHLQATIFQHVGDGVVSVANVIQLQTSKYMKISSATLSALHIFSTEYHPLVAAKGGGHAKEGCSLFSLLDRTVTSAGKSRLRDWMLKPLIQVDQIELRQNGIELLLHPDWQGAAQKLSELLRHVGPVAKMLTRMQKATTKPSDFVALTRAVSHAISVCDLLETDFRFPLRQRVDLERQAAAPTALPAITQDQELLGPPTGNTASYVEFVTSILGQCQVHVLKELLDRITVTIDSDATLECNQVVVARGFSDALDGHKDNYEALNDVMAATEDIVLARVPWLQNHLKVMFFPQVGYLVALQKQSNPNASYDDHVPEDFRRVFSEGTVQYFKTGEMHQLDNEIGDLDSLIKDMEKLIASQLEDDILACDGDLRQTFNALADLDCVLSLATVAGSLGYVRPKVVPAHEKCILIDRCSHPLQELLLDPSHTLVRNDVGMEDTNRVNVVTGPNFSGKSCYARQVGLLVYMAQLGSFLPCQAAHLSVFDRLLSQFSTVETCAVPQSSFQIDLTRMGGILRSVTPSSLVLIDEFGKGTSPASGIALLTAALEKLSHVGCLAVVTTHFLEMFSLNFLTDGVNGIRAWQMRVQIPGLHHNDDDNEDNNGASCDDEDAVPLFQLQPGVASSSAGLACAKLAGVKPSVLIRAREIVAQAREGQGPVVKPLLEVLQASFPSDASREVVRDFLAVNWESATEADAETFRHRLLAL